MEFLQTILDGLVLRAKAQIVRDALSGAFNPRPSENKTGVITCYGDLHDYVDANYYGGAFEDDVCNMLAGMLGKDPEDEDAFEEVVQQFFGPMQELLDRWIVDGGIQRVIKETEFPYRTIEPAWIQALAAGIPLVDSEIGEAFL